MKALSIEEEEEEEEDNQNAVLIDLLISSDVRDVNRPISLGSCPVQPLLTKNECERKKNRHEKTTHLFFFFFFFVLHVYAMRTPAS